MRNVARFWMVLLVAALNIAISADARENSQKVPMLYDPLTRETSAAGGFGVTQASSDTFYYGGTVWDAGDGRWEAAAPIAPGWTNRKMWTWSSTGFAGTPHSGQNMDGWVGVDVTTDLNDYFNVEDGTTIGACASSKVLFCGLTNAECAQACYVDLNGTGYGNGWNQMVVTPSAVHSSGDVLTLTYAYANETEAGYDFTYVVLQTYDTVAGAWENRATLATYDGLLGGTEGPIDLASYMVGGEQWRILFQFRSDGSWGVGWSDEDGRAPTACGAVWFDNFVIAGTTTNWSEGFEGVALDALPAGWSKVVAGCGDFAGVEHLNDLPVPLTEDPCVVELPWLCQVSDSVLVLCDMDTLGYPHPLCQDNWAKSPVVDFSSHPGLARKVWQVDRFADLPLDDHVFMYWLVRYGPGCEAGGWSSWLSDGYVYYTRYGTGCDTWSIDVSSHVPPSAEEAQMAVGVINLCDENPWGLGCTYTCNVTPYFDNATLATFGTDDAPYVSMSESDYWQDQFSEDGTLNPNSTADTRIAMYQSNLVPPIFGDTLVCRGSADNTEVYFVFRIATVSSRQALTHPFFTSWFPCVANGGWFEGRMDTAEVTDASGTSTVASPGQWMCAFHEDDLCAVANALPEGTEILPNNLFVPGTRIEYFLKARYSDSVVWFFLPDTTGEKSEEFEILPMMRNDGMGSVAWPCLIVADHFGQRGNWGETNSDRIIRHLEANGSDFDVFNKLGPSSDLRNGIGRWSANTGQIGSPGTDKYNWGPGATLSQFVGYKYCILNAGNVYGYSIYNQDVSMLQSWLVYLSSSEWPRFLWVSGDQVSREMNRRVPWGPAFLNTVLCATHLVNMYSDTRNDYTYCLPMNGVGGGRILCGEPESYVIRSRVCPGRYSDQAVIGVSSAAGCNAVAEIEFNAGFDGFVDYAAVSNAVAVPLGANYKTLLESYDFCLARTDDSQGPLGCGADGFLATWLDCVLNWAGYGPGIYCGAYGYVGAGDPGIALPTLETSLAHPFPNPTNPSARIQYTVGVSGKVSLRVFDVSGRVVCTLVDEYQEAGSDTREVIWDGRNERGERVSSGVFFYELEAPGFTTTKKIVILR